ncbi:hypothetical protein CsSME_00007951 [Camellia sinensis var. sinensis]
MRSSVVYPYVPFDCLRSLEDNLLSIWYTSTLSSRMVQRTPHPDEALGIIPTLLAKKEKLCSSDWLKCVNRLEFPSSFREAPIVPFLLSNPCWIEELRLTLFERQYFTPYQAPVPPTAYQQYTAQTLLAAFSHFCCLNPNLV